MKECVIGTFGKTKYCADVNQFSCEILGLEYGWTSNLWDSRGMFTKDGNYHNFNRTVEV